MFVSSYFNSEKLFICGFVFFLHSALLIFVETRVPSALRPTIESKLNVVVLSSVSTNEFEKDRVSDNVNNNSFEVKKKPVVNKVREKTQEKRKLEKPKPSIENSKNGKKEENIKQNKGLLPEKLQKEPKNDILEEENVAKVKDLLKIEEKGLSIVKEKTEVFQPIIVQNVTYIDKKSCAPKYPRLSKKRGENGKVLVKVLIGKNGFTENVQLEKSSGFGRLDKAAIKAANKCRFVAARKNGKTVKSLAIIPYNFIY
jgi:TonB family protein